MKFKLFLLGMGMLFGSFALSSPVFSQSNSFHHVICQKEYVVFESVKYARHGGIIFLPLKNILMTRKSKDSSETYGMIRIYDGGKEARWVKTDEDNIDRVMNCLKSRIR